MDRNFTMGKPIYLLLVWSSIFVLIDCYDRDSGEPLFLSEFVEQGDFSSARNLSLVRHKEMEWLTSYAGYFTINRQLNSNMFFWFFPAKYSASTAPLVLWLQGQVTNYVCRTQSIDRIFIFQVDQELRQ